MMTMATAGLALVVWTLVIWVWLYAERIPALEGGGAGVRRLRARPLGAVEPPGARAPGGADASAQAAQYPGQSLSPERRDVE